MKLRWPGFALVAVGLLLWQCASAFGWLDSVTVPRVTTVLASWWHDLASGAIPAQLGPSLRRITI